MTVWVVRHDDEPLSVWSRRELAEAEYARLRKHGKMASHLAIKELTLDEPQSVRTSGQAIERVR